MKLTAGDLTLWDQRKGGMSYQSAQDPRLHFGLGGRGMVDVLEVRWPSGMVTRLTGVAGDPIIAVKEGVGIVPRAIRNDVASVLPKASVSRSPFPD
ncbi:MAG: ASPIC/UnbV domain-containing protein [Bryobacteraceae bacterium]